MTDPRGARSRCLRLVAEGFAGALPNGQVRDILAGQTRVLARGYHRLDGVALDAIVDDTSNASSRRAPCARIRALQEVPVNTTGQRAEHADGKPMAATQRAGADIVEVEGSHVIMISQPQAVTDHIVEGAQAIAGSGR
jgi:hypothetical protein